MDSPTAASSVYPSWMDYLMATSLACLRRMDSLTVVMLANETLKGSLMDASLVYYKWMNSLTAAS